MQCEAFSQVSWAHTYKNTSEWQKGMHGRCSNPQNSQTTSLCPKHPGRQHPC